METQKIIIKIFDYTEFPGPRYCNQGDKSGEDFYHLILNEKFAEAYNSNSILEVILDQTAGFASSFLDQAFGNLVYDFSKKEVEKHLLIISEDEPDWIQLILSEVYIDWEKRRTENKEPKITTNHKPWFRLINKELKKEKWV